MNLFDGIYVLSGGRLNSQPAFDTCQQLVGIWAKMP